MSIDKKTILHIASEIIVIGGISVYFSVQNKKCQEKISILEHKIQQQELIIQNHEQLLLKLLNNVNLLNNNISAIQQNSKKKKTQSSSSVASSVNQKSNEINFIQDKNVNKQPLYEKPLAPPRFPNEQIIIMELTSDGNKNNSIYPSSSKVEEIPDEIEVKTTTEVNKEQSYDDLDKELENELNEMELEKELSELNDVQEIRVSDDEDDEED
jgi:hypothetical protein